MSVVLNIIVNDLPVEATYPIYLSVRTKRDKITWRQKVQEDDVQFAYLEAPLIISNEAIEVIDYLSIYAEAVDERVYATKDSVIVSSSPNLIFTTVTSDESNGFNPLFYCHRLPPEVDLVNFEPWNKTKDPTVSVYNKDKNAVFSNLANRLDVKNRIYSPSFVTYKTTIAKGSLPAGSNVNEIYRREPLYRQETIFDYSDQTFELYPNSSCYRKSQRADKLWVYEINKRPDETVFYKEDGALRPSVSVSPDITTKYMWPLEITGSRYTYRSSADGTRKVSYDWTIEDESRWFPYYPFLTLKQEANIINSKSFMVMNNNLILDPSSNVHLTVKVTRDDKAIIAQTTRSSLIGLVVSGSYITKDIVKYEKFTGGVDYFNGIISIDNSVPLLSTDRVIVEYVVDESRLQSERYNVNPLQNSKLVDGNLFYYVTPVTEETKSKIYWLHLQTRWNASENKYEAYIKNTNQQENLAYFLGKSFDWFVSNCCVYSPLEYTDLSAFGDFNYLPLCLLAFKKNKYIDETTWKDLRVHSGLKEDYTLENRGKDFSLSNILNPSSTYKLRPENQVLVFVDRSEIPDIENINLNQVVSETLGLDLIYTIRFLDFNNDLAYSSKMTEEGNITIDISFIREITSSELSADQTKLLNYLKVYHCADGETYSDSDILLGTQYYTTGYEDNPTYPYYTLTYNISNTVLNPANLNRKLYIYLKWENEEGTMNSGRSPVICLPIKDLPSTL